MTSKRQSRHESRIHTFGGGEATFAFPKPDGMSMASLLMRRNDIVDSATWGTVNATFADHVPLTLQFFKRHDGLPGLLHYVHDGRKVFYRVRLDLYEKQWRPWFLEMNGHPRLHHDLKVAKTSTDASHIYVTLRLDVGVEPMRRPQF